VAFIAHAPTLLFTHTNTLWFCTFMN
jgi:hypothetical protein